MWIACGFGIALGVRPEALERIIRAAPEEHRVEVLHAFSAGLVNCLIRNGPIQTAIAAREVAIRRHPVEHHDASHAASPWSNAGDVPIARTSTEPPAAAIGQPPAICAA